MEIYIVNQSAWSIERGTEIIPFSVIWIVDELIWRNFTTKLCFFSYIKLTVIHKKPHLWIGFFVYFYLLLACLKA